ncbi:MAG: hypothetical protein WBM04_05150 [Candidatus Korobacteraceae bacterium]
MKTLTSILARFALVVCVTAPALQCSAFAQDMPSPLTIGDESHQAHVFPTRQEALKLQATPSGPLTFHGGPVMSNVQTFAIIWQPPTLQNGASTSVSPNYRGVQRSLLSGYGGHGIGNNNTQYNSNCFEPYTYVGGTPDDFHCQPYIPGFGGVASYYVGNEGSFMGFYNDKKPYPSGGCTHPLLGTNCISDADLQAEIKLDLPFLKAKGWTGGRNQMILVYTSSGEGSCFQQGQSGDSCSYYAPSPGVGYCGYHSYFTVDGLTAIIYSNEAYTGAPYGNLACQFSPAVPSPNNDPVADAAASVASHELTEATTDPLLNAWKSASGAEIGDLCLNWTSPALTFGTNTWDGGKANQMWNGAFFELQMEYDNHTASCVQEGP